MGAVVGVVAMRGALAAADTSKARLMRAGRKRDIWDFLLLGRGKRSRGR